ncbi:cyclic nucleotide-binding domain-containing protein [Thermodesulfobacteriota bacterium]
MIPKEELLKFKIFEDITLEELDAVLDISNEVSFKPGEIILEESSFGTDSDFYIILNGNVKVELQASQINSDDKLNKRLTVLKSSDIFGEMGLLRKRRRSAQVTAYSDLTVLKVNQKKLFQLFVYNPRLGYIIMKNLAAILSDRIMEMNFMWRDDI